MSNQATPQEHDAMRRAFVLAAEGPRVGVNPQVGCVLLSPSGEVLAEGFHRGAGTPHAEVAALKQLAEQGVSPEGVTAVVSLEPCAHVGRTGPCAHALAEAGIARLVYSVADPGAHSGGGADYLRQHGVEVVADVLRDEGLEVIRHWHTATTWSRPFVTAKWGQSLDGRIAAEDGTSQWITSPNSRAQVHRDRAAHGAIMVGTETLLADNPALTARNSDGSLEKSQPLAVVMGHRPVPEDSAVRNHPGGFLHLDTRDPGEALQVLFERGIRSLYLEGGATLQAAFFRAGLVDEVHLTLGPLLLGGSKTALGDIGISSMREAEPLDVVDVVWDETDIRVIARVRRTPKTSEI